MKRHFTSSTDSTTRNWHCWYSLQHMGITLVSIVERGVQRHDHFAPVQTPMYSGLYRQPCMSCFTAADFRNRLEYQIDFHRSCAQVFSKSHCVKQRWLAVYNFESPSMRKGSATPPTILWNVSSHVISGDFINSSQSHLSNKRLK